MHLENASLNENLLTFKVSRDSLREASILVDEFKDGDYELKKRQKQRSKNANSYAWALMDKISKKTGLNITDVYLNEISGIAGRTKFLSMTVNAVEDFKRWFTKGHIGRKVEIIQTDGNICDLLIQLGSSDYDTVQMSQLINAILEDCRELGIETMDDNNLRSLLEEWE